ncbi:hypothetical protein Tco_0001248 [Tanacetum coccineum]
MLAICITTEPMAFKASKTSSKIKKKDPKGKKPGAKVGQRKISTPSTINTHFSKIVAKQRASLSKKATESQVGHFKRQKFGTAKDTNPSQPSVSTLVVTEMHKEVQQATNGPSSIGVTASTIIHFESASEHDALTDSIVEADLGKYAPNDSLSHQQDKTHSARDDSNDVTKEIKLEDMSKLVKDVNIDTIGLDSLEDDQPFMVVSDEEEEIHAEPHAKIINLKKEKVAIKAEATILSDKPSFPNVQQLTQLLELPSKLSEINEAVGGIKKYVEEFKVEIPSDLKVLPEKLESLILVLTNKVVALENVKLDLLAELLALLGKVSSINA